MHVVDEGVNCETRAFFEHWDFYARDVEAAWDFLHWLVLDTYKFEMSCANSYNPLPCIPDLAPSLCETCHCSDHDSTSCPYFISNEAFSRLSSMIETINEQHIEIVNRMWEYDLSRETDLRFSYAKLDVNFCDDGASFPPLESRLEAVCDPFLATASLIAPSSPSTLIDNTAFIMTFPDPPFPLAQSMEFEVGKTLSIDDSVDEDDTCYESNNALLRCIILMQLL